MKKMLAMDAAARHRDYLASLQDRKQQEKAVAARAAAEAEAAAEALAGLAAGALHQRERGFQTMWSGANQGRAVRQPPLAKREAAAAKRSPAAQREEPTAIPEDACEAKGGRRQWMMKTVHLVTTEGDVLRASPGAARTPDEAAGTASPTPSELQEVRELPPTLVEPFDGAATGDASDDDDDDCSVIDLLEDDAGGGLLAL